MATFFVDYEGGNDANAGTSFATRWKTINSGATAARIAPGDTIRIMASPDPTDLGVTATWTNNSPTLTLASALNALVDNCDTAWTASANVTCTANTTTYRTSTGSASQSFAGAFTTGLAARKALAGATDYSAYQGITFWIQTNTAIAASTLSLRLCSDSAGAVTVDTFVIPALPVVNAWVPVYVDKGAALGSSIQSVALYADADPGTAIVLLDNISVVKAVGNDNLNLTSLVGKNTAGEFWWAIRSINGTTVTLDNGPGAASGSTPRGYVGTTGSTTTYKRETIKVTMTSSGAQPVQDSGTSGNLITFSGGWNRTDMSTQTGATYMDGQSGTGTGWDSNLQTFVSLDKWYSVRYSIGVLCGPADWTYGTVGAIASTNTGVSLGTAGPRLTATEISAIQGAGTGLSLLGSALSCTAAYAHGVGETSSTGVALSARGASIGTLSIKNTGGTALALAANASNNISLGTVTIDTATTGINQTNVLQDFRIKTLSISSVTGTAFSMVGGQNYRVDTATFTSNGTAIALSSNFIGLSCIIGSLTTSGNTTVLSSGIFTGELRVNASSFGEVSPMSFTGSDYTSGRVTFQNFDGTANDHRTYYSSGSNGATVFADSTTRNSSQGLSWKFNILSTTFVSQTFPIVFPIAKAAVAANKQVTATLYTRRSNTGMHGTFRVRGGQIAGVSSDIEASSSAAIDTWEALTLIFTPTEVGVIELDFTCYGVTGADLFIHDFSIVQES